MSGTGYNLESVLAAELCLGLAVEVENDQVRHPRSARSGRSLRRASPGQVRAPPRETTAAIWACGSAAAQRRPLLLCWRRSSPLPVLRFLLGVQPRSDWPRRRANSSTSNTLARSCSSWGVSRSNSKVASPAPLSTSATNRLRGLWRLLPLPGEYDYPMLPRERSDDAHRTESASTSISSSRTGGRQPGPVPMRPRQVVAHASSTRRPVVGGLGEIGIELSDAVEGSGVSTQTKVSAAPTSRLVQSGGATGTARTT